MSKFAWVTLTTNDTYSLGALVLAHSLKRVSTAHQLVVLVTPGVSESMRNRLKEVYNVVQEVNVLDSQDAANLALLARPELGITFTKLHCWKLVQFEKCVFLDADILVVQNCDELFERDELSAAPDISWPDCFNSGVFVFRPSLDTFAKITEFAVKYGSFDGGDQGLLNQYFSDWSQKDINKHLPFIYNTHAFASYSYLPAFKQFRDRIKILHFAGRFKPWLANFDSLNKTAYAPQEFQHISDLVQQWWNIYCDSVHHGLSDQMNYPSSQFYINSWDRVSTHIQEYMPEYSNVVENVNATDDDCCDDTNFYDPWENYYEDLEKSKVTQTDWPDDEPIRNSYSEHIEGTTNIVETQSHDNIETHHSSSMHNQTEYFQPSSSLSQQQIEPICEEKSDIVSIKLMSESETIHAEEKHSEYSELRCEESANNVFCDNYENVGPQESWNTPTENVDNNNRNQLDEEHKEISSELEVNVSLEQPIQSPLDQQCEDFNSDRECFREEIVSEVIEPQVESSMTVNESEKSSEEREIEAGLAGALSRLILGEARTPEQEAYEQHMRRQCWESGNIDYCGRDSFENIWKKITQTLEAGSAKKEATAPPAPPSAKSDEPERLTSADIEDGKVEFDRETNSTITYKILDDPKGYEQIIKTPQPNGTMKTQTKTFYDPVPVPADEVEETLKRTTKTQKDSKKVSDRTVAVSNPNTTVFVRKIPNGREEVYTTVNADGTKSIEIKTFYDAEEEEITETTQVQQEMPGETRIITKQRNPQQRQIEEQTLVEAKKQTKLRRVNTEEQSTEEVNFRSEKTVQETRQVSQKTEISGKSVSTKTSNVEDQSHRAITDKKEKKKKTKQAPPPPFEDKPGQKTTVKEKKIAGGTEYHYTTVLEDGRTVTSVKTVYEQEEVEMSEAEIKKYKKQLKEAEKHKNITEATTIPTKTGTKQVVPSSENPGEVTTVETKKIKGGTEYHYTTVTADGIVKKSSKTVYDPVPVEGSDDEEEIIEEYEEEIIEPGESTTETFTTTKMLSSKCEIQEHSTQKKKTKKIKN